MAAKNKGAKMTDKIREIALTIKMADALALVENLPEDEQAEAWIEAYYQWNARISKSIQLLYNIEKKVL